jgi:hypothetical protein
VIPAIASATGIGEWSNGATPLDRTTDGIGVVLQDGRVLFAFGVLQQPGCCGYASRSQIYDPVHDSWSEAGAIRVPRADPNAALLPDGKVLAFGGDATNCTTGHRSTEIYDPASDTWTTAGPMAKGRVEPAWTTLQDGRIFVTSGADACSSSSSPELASTEIYSETTGAWSAAAPAPSARIGAQATLLADGRVLVAGGYTGSTSLRTVEIYDPVSNSWSTAASTLQVHELGALLTLPDGRVLDEGGRQAPPTTYAESETFDPATNTWTATGPMQAPGFYRSSTLLSDGRVLVADGITGDIDHFYLGSLAEVFDPATDTWSTATSSRRARQIPPHGGGGLLLHDGRVLVTAVGNQYEDHGLEPEIFDPLATPTPDAQDDQGYLGPGAGGGTALESVFSNDSLRPGQPTAENAHLTTVGSVPSGISLDPSDGSVDVDASVTPGTHVFEYRLCEVAYPARCDTAQVSVFVDAPRPVGASDEGTVDSAIGGTAIANVLANDTLADGSPATLADVTVSAPDLGPYVSLDTSDGSVDVTPGTPAGMLYFQYQICDKTYAEICGRGFVSVTVTPAGYSSPSITSGATASVGLRAPLDFQVTTTGTPTPTLSESGVLPAGVSFVDNGDGTAELIGAPAVGTAGAYPITITASNGVGSPASQPFTLTVTSGSSAPAIVSPPSDTETFGVSFTYTVMTTGYPVPTLKKTGNLPAGVTFTDNGNGTATIAGTPTNAAIGVYPLTLTAKSTAGTSTQSFSLTISKAPSIKKIPTTTAHVGTSLTIAITAKGFTVPSLAASGLPPGLALTDNGGGSGTISGAPSAGSGGSYSVTLTATNTLGSVSQVFTLKVNEAPRITSASTASATIGSAFSFTATATGFPAPKLSKSGTLPKGISFDAATGTFSGTPKAKTAGSYPITITAKNSTATSSQSFTLVVH